MSFCIPYSDYLANIGLYDLLSDPAESCAGCGTDLPTPVGSNVRIDIAPQVGNLVGFSIIFTEVTSPGVTSVGEEQRSVEVSAGVSVDAERSFNISTTCSYTGNILLVFTLPPETTLEEYHGTIIFHDPAGQAYDSTASYGSYEDRTVYGEIAGLDAIRTQAASTPPPRGPNAGIIRWWEYCNRNPNKNNGVIEDYCRRDWELFGLCYPRCEFLDQYGAGQRNKKCECLRIGACCANGYCTETEEAICLTNRWAAGVHCYGPKNLNGAKCCPEGTWFCSSKNMCVVDCNKAAGEEQDPKNCTCKCTDPNKYYCETSGSCVECKAPKAFNALNCSCKCPAAKVWCADDCVLECPGPWTYRPDDGFCACQCDPSKKTIACGDNPKRMLVPVDPSDIYGRGCECGCTAEAKAACVGINQKINPITCQCECDPAACGFLMTEISPPTDCGCKCDTSQETKICGDTKRLVFLNTNDATKGCVCECPDTLTCIGTNQRLDPEDCQCKCDAPCAGTGTKWKQPENPQTANEALDCSCVCEVEGQEECTLAGVLSCYNPCPTGQTRNQQNCQCECNKITFNSSSRSSSGLVDEECAYDVSCWLCGGNGPEERPRTLKKSQIDAKSNCSDYGPYYNSAKDAISSGNRECLYPCVDRGLESDKCLDKYYINTQERFESADQNCPSVCREMNDCACPCQSLNFGASTNVPGTRGTDGICRYEVTCYECDGNGGCASKDANLTSSQIASKPNCSDWPNAATGAQRFNTCDGAKAACSSSSSSSSSACPSVSFAGNPYEASPSNDGICKYHVICWRCGADGNPVRQAADLTAAEANGNECSNFNTPSDTKYNTEADARQGCTCPPGYKRVSRAPFLRSLADECVKDCTTVQFPCDENFCCIDDLFTGGNDCLPCSSSSSSSGCETGFTYHQGRGECVTDLFYCQWPKER